MIEIPAFDPSQLSGTLETNGVNKNEQLMVYNDSIYRLRFTFGDGSIGVIPALWNKDYIIKTVPMGKIKWVVIDNLNIQNNPSNIVYGELYETQEHVASVNASMQRSVVSSIPGGIAVANSTLINDGNALPTKFLEVTPAGAATSTFSFSSDGTILIAQDIAAVLTTFLQSFPGATTVLKAGITGKIVEILGQLTVDQAATISGILTAPAANVLGAVGVLTHILGTLTVDQATTLTGLLTATGQITGAAAQNLDLNAVTGKQVRALVNNVMVMAVDPGGFNISSAKVFDGSANNLIDWTIGGCVMKGQASAHNRFTYMSDGTNVDWFLNALSSFTGAASGTFNHNLKTAATSIAPDIVMPITNVAGSQTMGYDTVTSTQCHITLGAALSFKAWCFK